MKTGNFRFTLCNLQVFYFINELKKKKKKFYSFFFNSSKSKIPVNYIM